MTKHLFHAALIAAATMTSPMAQAAAIPTYAPHVASADVLINRPNVAAEIQLAGLRPPSVASLIRLAASLALRAMIDFTLNAGKSSRYQHAARHLAECDALASQIEDFGTVEPHANYVARLRRDHGRKSGFWTRLEEK